MRILYTAAHGGFAGQPVPLGGGGAIAERLLDYWRAAGADVQLISPAILGSQAPAARDIVSFSERGYARFSRAFSAAATAEVLRHDPRSSVVLANDVSEGPDFARLAAAGFALYTIYHVDVVAYISDIYLHGRIGPRKLAAAWELLRRAGLSRLLPAMLGLIFEQQRASIIHGRGVIVPSAAMRELLLECYPAAAGKVHVIPWGAPPPAPLPGRAAARQALGIPAETPLLLTLSRISPEKGQHLLLDAVREWEGRADYPAPAPRVVIAGAPAYMQGERYAARLRALAAGLRRTRVDFVGHAAGDLKQRLLAAADLYVFPSRHESYGLTLMEALAAGLPAVALDHAGAREVLTPDCGVIVPASAGRLRGAIAELLAGPARRARMSVAARARAASQPFEASASRLTSLLAAGLAGA